VLKSEEVLKHYQVDLEAEVEDMLCVKLNQGEEEEGLVFAVYYNYII